MANRRMIASDIFEDDFIGGLSWFERLLWIGSFGSIADDQGRFLDAPALVRSKVFLYDEKVTDNMTEQALVKLATAGKVIRYEAKCKHLIQITKWWIYQTPSWASPSKYPAPIGWVDRLKYHAAGNKIITLHWDEPGGLPSQLPSPQGSGIEEGEGEGDVKGDVKGEGEAGAPVLDPFSQMQALVEKMTGYPSGHNDLAPLDEFVTKGVIEDDIREALTFLDGKKKVHGAADLRNSVMVAFSKRIQNGNTKKRKMTDAEGNEKWI